MKTKMKNLFLIALVSLSTGLFAQEQLKSADILTPPPTTQPVPPPPCTEQSNELACLTCCRDRQIAADKAADDIYLFEFGECERLYTYQSREYYDCINSALYHKALKTKKNKDDYDACTAGCRKGYSAKTDGIGGDETNSNINMYPNPAQSDLFVEINSENSSTLKLTLTNMLGAVVKEITLNQEAGYQKHTIPVSDIANGIYFVNVTGDVINKQQKIVVAH